MSADRLRERIVSYLSTGGLFNPEQMQHDLVRQLLCDCLDALAASDAPAPSVNSRLLEVAKWAVYALEHGSHIEVHWLNTVAKEKHAWARTVIAEAEQPPAAVAEGGEK